MNAAALRQTMAPVSRTVRAYFAPVDRATGAAAIFDPSKHGGLDVDAPPPPWIDVGWIQNFRRTAATAHERIRAGAKGAVTAQIRRRLEAGIEFEFRQWGKLQMALAGGSQHMNVLASEGNADPFPSGGSPQNAAAVGNGSTAQEIIVGAGVVDAFNPGDLVAVDVDYQQQAGYVGTGIAAAYVRDPGDVLRDRHYIRRVTFNVGRVALKTTTTLILAQPLLAGIPPEGASAQKVVGFVDREGGSFWQEWSALFVIDDESGGRVCFHYPRLQSSAAAAETRAEMERPFAAWSLRAQMLALPALDRNDGEQVLCYRSYFPAASAAVY